MNNLPFYYYAPVFFKKEEIIFDFINPRFMSDLKRNAAFIDYVSAQEKDQRFYRLDERRADFEESSFFNNDTSPENIGIKVIRPNETILRTIDFNEFYSKAPWVVTDRYFYPHGYRHVGSSRHGLLYNCQLKGIGQNNLTHRGDFLHSWGGYPFYHAITSIINNIYIDETTTLGALPIWAIGRFKNLSIPSEPQSPALQIRSSDCFRMAHYDPGTSLKDKTVNKIIIHDLEKKFKSTNPEEIKSIVVNQYREYFANNINPSSSLIPENLLFDGRAIDTDEYEIHLSKSHIFSFTFNPYQLTTIEDLQKISSRDIVDFFRINKLPARFENLQRITSSWLLYATILDEIYDRAPQQDKNIQMLKDQLFKESLTENEKYILNYFYENAFTKDIKNFSSSKISDELWEVLLSLKLTSAGAGKDPTDPTFVLSFSEDEASIPLKSWATKFIEIHLTDKFELRSPDSAASNYKNLEESLKKFIKFRQ